MLQSIAPKTLNYFLPQHGAVQLDQYAFEMPDRRVRCIYTTNRRRFVCTMSAPAWKLKLVMDVSRNPELDFMRSEREKMLLGELYDAVDPELVTARERARDLCMGLNATPEREQETRRRILQELFGSGGDSVWMQPPFYCDYGSNIYLGERVYFNFNCVILDVCEVRIGDFAFFGPAVQIYAATHPINAQLRRTQEFGKPVTIGSDVWIGGGAIICPGVTIGSRTVIGAGSVVTKDIPDGVVAAGNPCRIIREVTEADGEKKTL